MTPPPIPPSEPMPHSYGRRKSLGEKSNKSKGLNTKHSFASLARSDKGERGGRFDSARSEPGDMFYSPNSYPHHLSSPASRGNKASRILREFGSSNTLHSYYDPHNMSPAVSLQTSNVAAREWSAQAAKMGYPDMRDKADKKKSKSNRPSRLDLSNLFPRSKSKKNEGLSPIQDEPSWSAAARTDILPPKTPPSNQPKSRGKDSHKDTTSRHSVISNGSGGTAPYSVDGGYAKNTSRKPKPGATNWFDSIEDEFSDEHVDLDAPPMPPIPADIVSKSRKNYPQRTSSYLGSKSPGPVEKRISRDTSGSTVNRNSTAAGSFSSSVRRDLRVIDTPETPSSSLLSPKLVDITASRQLRAKSRNADKEKTRHRRERSDTVASRRSNGSALSGADLKMESMLSLSSSSDEDEYESDAKSDAKSKPSPSQKVSIRNSILSAFDSDADIGTATAIHRKSIISTASGHSLRTQASDPPTTPIPAVPSAMKKMPQRRGPGIRSSSLRSTEGYNRRSRDPKQRISSHPEEVLAAKTFSERGSMISQRDKRSTIGSKMSDECDIVYVSTGSDQITAAFPLPNAEIARRESVKTSNRRSRIMSVTRQEESLLEAMRQKRAMMRENTIRETPNPITLHSQNHTTTIPEHSYPTYPTTSHIPYTSSESSTATVPGLVPDVHLYSEDGTGTELSNASTRASLVLSGPESLVSDEFPSPSTTNKTWPTAPSSSPMTPTTTTMPPHTRPTRHNSKKSPVMNAALQSPPPISPPSDATRSRSHSRRRTDSSTALDFENEVVKVPAATAPVKQVGRAKKESVDDSFPVWAYTGFPGARDSIQVVQ